MGAFFRRYSFGSLIAGAIVLTLGLGISGLTATYLAKDISLWLFGKETLAHVTDLWVEQINEDEEGELSFEYFAEYQFTTPEGTAITKVTTLAPQEWSGLNKGTASTGDTKAGGDNTSEVATGVYQEQAITPEGSTGDIEEGSPLTVVYFPPYPQHNRLEESQYIPILALSYVPLIALSIITFAVGWHFLNLPTREKASPSLRERLKG